jgi:hypothetical protein
MEPVSRQIIDRYAVLKKYFLTELPKYEKTMISSTKSRCERVRLAFQDPVTLVYLNFVAVLASYVTPFLLMFQSSQPLVHVLYQI